MKANENKCARNIIAYGIVICMITTVLPFPALLGEEVGDGLLADNYAVAGWSTVGVGSVLDSPEDGTSALGAGVRSWVLDRSNEIATESQITGQDPPPGGIFQTTDFVDDGTGTIGRSWVDHGFLIDCAGFPTQFRKTAPFEELIIEIGKETANGGYTASCDLVINNDHQIGDLPTNGGFVPLHKIGGMYGTGVSGVDYFDAARTSATVTTLAWPAHPDEWGNVYGYRVFRNSTSEPWHAIANLTGGSGTTGYTDSTCQADAAYNYQISILYRGMQGGLQNAATAVESLYRSYAVASLSLLSVTPTPADGAVGQPVATAYSLEFSRAMNTAVGNVTINPAPAAAGAWAWESDIWYNYTGAAWNELTRYYLNLTDFKDLSGNGITGDANFNFTTGDFTAPTSNVTGPATANTLTFNVTYIYNDPSGVTSVELYYTTNGGLLWTLAKTSSTPNGTFSYVTVPADGLYGWYTLATDASANSEPAPGIGTVEFVTLVDTVLPLIGSTTADKLFINNRGTHGGTAPPVSVTTNVTDETMLAMAAWGIRNENANPNGTIYFQVDISNDTMPSTQQWDGMWYFVDGVLVTAGMCPDWFVTEIFVMGELNGASAGNQPLGYVLPSHYILYDMTGIYQGIYATLGTPQFYDDLLVVPLGGDTFRPYRYDEGVGYVATASFQTYTPPFDWLNLTIAPIPDGRYTVAVTAFDTAQNVYWTNEAQGNPVINVDTVAPNITATVPTDMATAVALNQDIVITFSETMDNATVTYTVTPNPGNLVGVWSAGNTVLTITHDDFAELTLYTAEVTVGKDPTGNNLAAGIAPNPWTFTTGDFTQPTSSVNAIAPYWQTVTPLAITGTAGDALSTVATVELWYRYAADNITWDVWTLFGTDAAAPWEWDFSFPGGNGYYEFYSRATDTAGNYEDAPLAADTLSAYDSASPTSAVNAISPYWLAAQPLTITATATDLTDGVTAVELWYRFAADNATWGAWANFGTLNAAPWSWNFTFPDGDGYYELYTRASDAADNYESAPADADAICGYDTVNPTSSIDAISPYWQTSSPINLSAQGSDSLSGLAYLDAWYRFAPDNATWTAWIFIGSDPTAPYGGDFNFPNGNGYYEFYSRATDLAGNNEDIPATAGALCAFDSDLPMSNVDAITPYWHTTMPLTATATVTEALSGITYVEFWYSHSADNITFGAYGLFGTDNAAPWSWDFDFPSGNGYYRFHSRAADLAGNYEDAPATADAICAYDTVNPTSSVDPIAPYWQNASPLILTATATDITDGIAQVELWYRFASDNSTWGAWSLFGTDNASPWSWPFTSPDGDGYYEFYTRATDGAGNYEDAAISADAACGYDSIMPISSADAISPYWQTASPLNGTATASDSLSGMESLELWFRFSVDNATWGAWTYYGTDDAAPWYANFFFPNGNGYYEFYTIAIDNAGNSEVAPAMADAICGFDSALPISSIDAIAPYWQTVSSLNITATASALSGVDTVELWYRFAVDNSTWGAWTLFGTDNAAPWSWEFTFPDGNGYYEFYSRATDTATNYEDAPATADEICAYDTIAPSSEMNEVLGYWIWIGPLWMTATANDTLSGLADVELWYRFSADNATWGAWTLGTAHVALWNWDFAFPEGNGYYEFYTRATDIAGNYEDAPISADAICGYDTVDPTSSTETIAPYWQTSSPLTINATANDGLSGLASVELWYRHSADNMTWGAWTLFGTDNAAPWSWGFDFPDGNGYYEFYTRATDDATNYEDAPASADVVCAFSSSAPISSVDAIAPYWQTASPLAVTATASALSGVDTVELWYRFSANNGTWGAWTLFGTDDAAPWSWIFNFPNGNGYYQFYTRARDTATNYEAAPASADRACAFDNAAPTSTASAITPYWRTASPVTVTATASDITDGVATVELWYRYSTDNATWGAWTLFGTDNAAPWSWNFGFPGGNGYYEFYSRAYDAAGNYENAPGARDSLCAFDSAAPASTVDSIIPYWQTSSPLTITATANDGLSGLASVELWFRFSADNATWGAWALFGTDNASPWSWSFNFPGGAGHFQFYARARDVAGNYEAAPGVADELAGYDNQLPASIALAITPYWHTVSPLTVDANAADTLSGLAAVELWYSFSADNATWSAWTLFGTDNAAPWSWSFGFPSGDGYYLFYSRALDVAGNYEAAPAVRDALCGYDTVFPEIDATSPMDGETDMPFSQDIVITFSEPMDTGTVTYTVTPNPGNLVTVWTANNTVLTISHDAFVGSQTYFVHVTAGQDLAGNALIAGNTSNPWSFTTMAVIVVDYIQIETLANGGTLVGDHTMTIDQTFTVWAIGYSTIGGRIGPVSAVWSTTGTLDAGATTAQSFTFSPASAVTYGTIRAAYGLLRANTGLITVNPGTPTSFVLSPLAMTITADQTMQFATDGRDAMGNPTGPVGVTWSITHSTLTASAANGTISAGGMFTPGLVAIWTVTAENATLGSVTTTITVTVGALAGIKVDPPYAEVDAGVSIAFTVSGHDAKGNLLSSTGTTVWYLDGSLQASGSISSSTAGNHTVFASNSGFIGIAHLNVNAAPGSRIIIDQTGVSINADATYTFTVTIMDAYGNTVGGAAPTITWIAENGTIINGLFTPWSAGTWTIRANSAGYTGGAAQITVTSGSVSRIVISPSGGTGTRDTSITVGQSSLFTVNALDQRDNLVSVPSLYLTWATTIGTVSNGFFTAPTTPGTGVLRVTYAYGATTISGSENITVGNGPLHHIIISPASAVGLNEYQTFTAAGYDIYGNPISGLGFTWGTTGNVGTIDTSGVFRGTGKGLGTVTATVGGIQGELPVYVSTPEGIFASWLWLAIVLFIVCIVLVILLIIGRRKEVIVMGEHEPDDSGEEPSEEMPEDIEKIVDEGSLSDIDDETTGITHDEVPEEFKEPLAELEEELLEDDAFKFSEEEIETRQPEEMDAITEEPEIMVDHEDSGEGPGIISSELKGELAEALRIERCEKMLAAVVVLPDDKSRLKMLIAGGLTPSEFSDEVSKAVDRRKKKEKSREVTAEEKASILEDELVAELAELEDDFDKKDKPDEDDLEDQILKEIEDLEDL